MVRVGRRTATHWCKFKNSTFNKLGSERCEPFNSPGDGELPSSQIQHAGVRFTTRRNVAKRCALITHEHIELRKLSTKYVANVDASRTRGRSATKVVTRARLLRKCEHILTMSGRSQSNSFQDGTHIVSWDASTVCMQRCDGVSGSLPLEPHPLGIEAPSGLSRAAQLSAAHSVSIPFVPAYCDEQGGVVCSLPKHWLV